MDMHLILTRKGPLIKTRFWWWGCCSCRVMLASPPRVCVCVCVCVCDVTVTKSAGGIPPADATWFRHRSSVVVIVGVVVKHLRESHNTHQRHYCTHSGTCTRRMEGGTPDPRVRLSTPNVLSFLFFRILKMFFRIWPGFRVFPSIADQYIYMNKKMYP